MTENRRGGIRKIEQSRGMLNKKRFKRRTGNRGIFQAQRKRMSRKKELIKYSELIKQPQSKGSMKL